MKAIILAAGKSSRLYPLTIETPKCLLEITEGLSIIELQVYLLNKLGVDDILIVTGFENNKIENKLKKSVKYHYYDKFMKTNNLHTMNAISEELNDETLILFSDVLISKGLLEKCLNSLDDFNLILDDKNISDKTMRVLINNHSIYDIGAHIPVNEGDANFIGIAKYSKKGIKILKDHINKLCDSNDYLDEYYTIALTDIAKTGIKIKYTLNDGYYWNEIDYLEDYLDVKNNYNVIKNNFFGDDL